MLFSFLRKVAFSLLLFQLVSSYNTGRLEKDASGKEERSKTGAGEKSLAVTDTKTIDQLIVDASGGPEAASKMEGRLRPGGLIRTELDLNLTPQQYIALYGQEEIKLKKRKATSDIETRWPNGTIPYVIIEKDFSEEEIREIKAAMADWETMTCLHFRPALSTDKNSIRFQDGDSCNSALGMIGGIQDINLSSPGCRFKGLYLHELGHAIGLVHEHQLPQRDDYITIKYSNVAPGMRVNFRKLKESAVLYLGVEYDYASVMHYGKTAFSYNGKAQTIFTRDKRKENLIGYVAEKALSFSDVKAVNLMYRCNATCASHPTCVSPCFINKDCKCFCKDDMPKKPCANRQGDKPCEGWAGYGECEKNPDYMHRFCAKACHLCTEGPKTASQQGEGETTTKPGTCFNDYGDICEEWAANDECNRNSDWMTVHCRKACDKCSLLTSTTSSTTTTLETAAEDCVNKYGDRRCEQWSSTGQCRTNPGFMFKQCQKACGRCSSHTTTATTATTAGKSMWTTTSTITTPANSDGGYETTASVQIPSTTTIQHTLTTTNDEIHSTTKMITTPFELGAEQYATTASPLVKTQPSSFTTSARGKLAAGATFSAQSAQQSTAVLSDNATPTTTSLTTAAMLEDDRENWTESVSRKVSIKTTVTARVKSTIQTTTNASTDASTETTTVPYSTPTTTALPCQDEDRRCVSWTVYCGRNTYVNSHCHKTCGTC